MGTWDGTICSAVLTNNNATVTSQLTGTIVGIIDSVDVQE